MTDRLAGKTAFITAAGQGIGRATAEAFVREGARVIATDINEALLADLQKATGCSTRRLDVTDAARCSRRRPRPSARARIDILFNGAGYVHAGTILECDEVAFDFSFDLNVRSMYRMIRAFLPPMLEARRRLDHQRRLGRAQHQGRAEPLRLRHHQGGGDRPDQVDRRRLHHQGHPLQRDLPGHGRVAVAARADRGPGQGQRPDAGAGAGGVRRAPADGPARHAPRRSPRSRSISRATNRPSPPARRRSSTAAGRIRLSSLPSLTKARQ